MIGLYYLLVCLVLVLIGPALLVFKKKARFGLTQKLGAVPSFITPKGNRRRIWFHTVSVGEFLATLPLISLFNAEHPDCEIFISTTTGTGQALAQEKAGSWATIFYFPYDVPWAVGTWLDAVQPDVVAITETEIWPGFVDACAKRGVKLCCVNGRISPRSVRGYQSLSAIIKPTLGKYDAVAVQSEQEALRYRLLGARADAVFACGNMKFDGMKASSVDEQAQLRAQLNLQTDDIVIVGGSTHEGEESALLEALNGLTRSAGRVVRLIIAPRHPERFQRVYQVVESYGFRARCYSRGEGFERENDVYVLDTIGELMKFYSLATVAFVGGTIAPIGGHNIVEPCIYEVPVVCGPHIEKTRDVFRCLVERQAIVQIQTGSAMTAALEDLIASPQKRAAIGQAGKRFLDDSQGAVRRTIQVLNSVYNQGVKTAEHELGQSTITR